MHTYTHTYIHTLIHQLDGSQDYRSSTSVATWDAAESHTSEFQQHDGGFSSLAVDEEGVLVTGVYVCMHVCVLCMYDCVMKCI